MQVLLPFHPQVQHCHCLVQLPVLQTLLEPREDSGDFARWGTHRVVNENRRLSLRVHQEVTHMVNHLVLLQDVQAQLLAILILELIHQ